MASPESGTSQNQERRRRLSLKSIVPRNMIESAYAGLTPVVAVIADAVHLNPYLGGGLSLVSATAGGISMRHERARQAAADAAFKASPEGRFNTLDESVFPFFRNLEVVAYDSAKINETVSSHIYPAFRMGERVIDANEYLRTLAKQNEITMSTQREAYEEECYWSDVGSDGKEVLRIGIRTRELMVKMYTASLSEKEKLLFAVSYEKRTRRSSNIAPGDSNSDRNIIFGVSSSFLKSRGIQFGIKSADKITSNGIVASTDFYPL